MYIRRIEPDILSVQWPPTSSLIRPYCDVTSRDLLSFQFEHLTTQFEALYRDLPAELWDVKMVSHGMSFRETTVHLMECCEAFLTVVRGEKWPWGTYSVPDDSASALIGAFFAKRQEAIGVALGSDDESLAKNASLYLVCHEPYHVGQLCQLRLFLQPDWNSDSIYG